MITQYLQQGDTYRFSDPFDKLNVLPAGTYSVQHSPQWGIFLRKARIVTDDLLEMDGSPAQTINKKVNDFLKLDVKAAFDRYSMLYKRGMLLYGPPGTGKTSVVNLAIRNAIEKDMIVLVNPHPDLTPGAINSIRMIEQDRNKDWPKRPIMVVWEEFEDLLDYSETEILDVMDGIDQVDNIFFIATTNYINQIPSRIRNRPSRFAEVIEIGAPNADLRRAYLEAKIHKEDEVDLDKWVEATEGFVLDHLKDLVISTLVLKLSFEDAIKKINIMRLEDELEFHRKNNDKRGMEDVGFRLEKELGLSDEAVETVSDAGLQELLLDDADDADKEPVAQRDLSEIKVKA